MTSHKVTNSVTTLEDRIAAAFTDSAKSEDFPRLIADVEAAAEKADDTATRARDRALDPTCPPTEVASARKEMDDARFTSDRMNVASSRLRERFRQVAAREEDQRRRIEYDRVLAARDALAKELAETYPQMAATLANLLARCAANNDEIAATKRPEGAPPILTAELIARGSQGWGAAQITSVIADTRLPGWNIDVHVRYFWPLFENTATRGPQLSRVG